MPSLRNVRRRANLSQPQLAAKSGVNQTTISMLELGKIPGPRLRTLQRLARAIGVTDAVIFAALSDSLRDRRVRERRRYHALIRARQAAGLAVKSTTT